MLVGVDLPGLNQSIEFSSNKEGLEQSLVKMMRCFVHKKPSKTVWVHGISLVEQDTSQVRQDYKFRGDPH